MRARIGYWSNIPDCSQILTDAFGVPLCVYSNVAEEDSSSVTYLPIDLPDMPSDKPRPIDVSTFTILFNIITSMSCVKIHLTGALHLDSVVINLMTAYCPV
ncbi:hypothetical protein BDB01DRAFT_834405 [Pilobolus umbonatus]|nr:hypothetical protein BDB01DRAFT_834405 [Pilobolus umbonatus]